MGIFNNPEKQQKKQDKEHVMHLVQIAKADGFVEQSELMLLYHYGKKMGFTETEIDDMIKSTKESDFRTPYELEKRFDQLYRIVKMVFSDVNIDLKDMELVTKTAAKSGFQPHEISILIPYLLVGIKKGMDSEELFDEYFKGGASLQ